MKLIGLTGKAGAGKDTVADYLVEMHRFKKISLADPIKRMLDVIGVDCRTRETKEVLHPIYGASPRRMAQTLGTEWGRELICQNIWLLYAEQVINEALAEKLLFQHRYAGVVVSDIRFENEAAWLRSQGGALWHIRRDDIQAVEAHSSEDGVAFMQTDETIYNYGTIEYLYDCIDGTLIPDEVSNG